MPLATKNNALIVKDGKVAENCNCCGGACCEVGPFGSTTTCSIKPQRDCQGIGQTFKGVGTTCEAVRCCGESSSCVCHCTENGGVIPRFLNLIVKFNWVRDAGAGSFSVAQSATLTKGAIYDTAIGLNRRSCWSYASPASMDADGWAVSASCRLETDPSGQKNETITLEWFAKNLTCPIQNQFGFAGNFARNGSFVSSRSAGNGTGLCFAAHTGQTHTETQSIYRAETEPCGTWTGSLDVEITINGFSA